MERTTRILLATGAIKVLVPGAICDQCGQVYPQPDARARRFCSPACRYRAWALEHRHKSRRRGRPPKRQRAK